MTRFELAVCKHFKLTAGVVIELMKEGAMTTVLSTLVAALAWPATLVTSFDLIDSKWAIALDR